MKEEKDLGASLLCGDARASQSSTETLPNGNECGCGASERLVEAEKEIGRLTAEVKELNGYLDRNGL